MDQLNDLFRDVPLKTLGDVDRLLIRADQTLQEGRRSAAVIGIAHMRVMSAGLSLTLRYLETRYRFLGSDTFLIAPSSDLLPSHYRCFLYPTDEPAKHWIWIGVNGAKEAKEAMHRFGIADADDNLARLETTGFLRSVGHSA